MATRRAVLSVAIAGAASLAGCASSNPALYTLAAVPGVARGGGPRVVVLRQIGLPRYLDRSQVVRSSDNYRLDIDANNWWGEPLGAMIARVLEQELSERLPGTSVFSDTGAIAAEADATVEINIQRMDADAAGTVILAAQAAVVFTGGAQGAAYPGRAVHRPASVSGRAGRGCRHQRRIGATRRHRRRHAAPMTARGALPSP